MLAHHLLYIHLCMRILDYQYIQQNRTESMLLSFGVGEEYCKACGYEVVEVHLLEYDLMSLHRGSSSVFPTLTHQLLIPVCQSHTCHVLYPLQVVLDQY